MRIEILGTESLGVRGLSCRVDAAGRVILIDPGVALGYKRYGLLPHPFQVARGVSVRREIISVMKEATDIVISHYHGDHIPLADANPYQLSAGDIPDLRPDLRLWCRSPVSISEKMAARAENLAFAFGRSFNGSEGGGDELLSFSQPMPHGLDSSHLGSVMMTRIEDKDEVFVHASDIQLLNRESVIQILDWCPDTVLLSGPPLYLNRLSPEQVRLARQNAAALAGAVETLIIDHHVARSMAGVRWLESISEETGSRILCAADFMGRPRMLLEAWRKRLYRDMPVPDNWHERYARGETGLEGYRRWQGYRT